jgi:hypothetical protein
MAKRHSFARFTPLMESGNGLRPSQRESSGGRLYKGVTIIKAGLGNRRDMHFYPADSLRAAVREGKFEGIRAYADHPTSIDDQIQPERTIRDMVGLYENAKYVESGGGRVVADLRVLRAHKWLAEVIDELIEVKHADKIGISINGAGETEVREVNVDGETLEVNAVAEFQKIRSADIVTEAGAGGGFQQILESARGASRETMNERQKLVKALKEAGKTGNVKTIRECAAALEAHDAEIAGSKGKKAGKKVAEAAEDTRRKAKSRRAAAADEGDEEDEDVVAGREVDDAVDDAAKPRATRTMTPPTRATTPPRTSTSRTRTTRTATTRTATTTSRRVTMTRKATSTRRRPAAPSVASVRRRRAPSAPARTR